MLLYLSFLLYEGCHRNLGDAQGRCDRVGDQDDTLQIIIASVTQALG